jgi:hypothetical protein
VAHTLKVAPGQDPQNPLVITSGGQLVTDRYGMSTARVVWWYRGQEPTSKVLMTAKHPTWMFLDMDKRTITKRDDGAWDIVGDFYGVDGTPDPIYSFESTTSQEPIETHKKFATFAGTPDTPMNGAVFDSEDQTFVTFRQLTTQGSVTNAKWVGVTAYLAASIVWRETKVTKTKPTADEIKGVGFIDTPPGDPGTPSGRTWLNAALAYDRKGKTYTIRKEWLLSGPAGWNDVLYVP